MVVRNFSSIKKLLALVVLNSMHWWKKMKLFYGIGLSHFSRIAVVTPNKWMSRLIDLEGKFFNKIDMKGFSSDEKELAILFLSKE